jgi:hypothetical protein
MQGVFNSRFGSMVVTSAPSEGREESLVVRVLWDVENLSVPPSLGAVQTVSRIQSFLQRHGLDGTGVNFHMTAFGNMANRGILRHLEDLDKASVEIVSIIILTQVRHVD